MRARPRGERGWRAFWCDEFGNVWRWRGTLLDIHPKDRHWAMRVYARLARLQRREIERLRELVSECRPNCTYRGFPRSTYWPDFPHGTVDRSTLADRCKECRICEDYEKEARRG